MKIQDWVFSAINRLTRALAQLPNSTMRTEAAPQVETSNESSAMEDAVPEDMAPEDTASNPVFSMRLNLHETARPVLLCFKCEQLASLEREDSVIHNTLLGKPPSCPKCNAVIDVWKNTLFAMSHQSGIAMAAQVGARHTAILYRLGVGEVVDFDVRDKGIPMDASILRIKHKCTFGTGLAVTDLDAVDSARAPDYRVRVIGVRVSDSDCSDMQAQTTVTWAHHDADDDGRRSLNRALLAIADGRIEEAVVPANVAVEVTLAAVVKEHLHGLGIGKTRLVPFLDAVTYSHQLNVLLPTVLAGTGAPAMSNELRGILNQLRDLRNAIGHRGKPLQPLTRETVGRCIAGAVFGFHYVRLAREYLIKYRERIASS